MAFVTLCFTCEMMSSRFEGSFLNEASGTALRGIEAIFVSGLLFTRNARVRWICWQGALLKERLTLVSIPHLQSGNGGDGGAVVSQHCERFRGAIYYSVRS